VKSLHKRGKKFRNEVRVEGVQLPEVRKKQSESPQISIFGFQCVAINIEG
jgi:hypothetical protein